MAENINYFSEAIKCSLATTETSVLSQLHIKTIEDRQLIE